MEELVFAVPTADLWSLLPYNKTGFIKGDSDTLSRIVQKGVYRKRSELEADISFKQLIPYAIISYNEPDRSGVGQWQSFYLFKRTSGQTEKRLLNKLHLGVGGHVNPGQSDVPDLLHIVNELKRELFEEVRFLNGCLVEDIEFIGFINDDSIPVGCVHIGLLYEIKVSNKDILINETDKMTAQWIDKADLDNFYEEMETWTRIAIDNHLR